MKSFFPWTDNRETRDGSQGDRELSPVPSLSPLRKQSPDEMIENTAGQLLSSVRCWPAVYFPGQKDRLPVDLKAKKTPPKGGVNNVIVKSILRE